MARQERLLVHSFGVELFPAGDEASGETDDRSDGGTERDCGQSMAVAADTCADHDWDATGDGEVPDRLSTGDERDCNGGSIGSEESGVQEAERSADGDVYLKEVGLLAEPLPGTVAAYPHLLTVLFFQFRTLAGIHDLFRIDGVFVDLLLENPAVFAD